MHRVLRSIVPLFAGCTLLLGGCQDELPTAGGEDLFPRLALNTIEVVLESEAFFAPVGRFPEEETLNNLDLQIVADDFGGALQAHALFRLVRFPQVVTWEVDGETQTDSSFVFGAGRLVAVVDSVSSVAEGPVSLQLWSLGQTWDRSSVSWQMAVDTAGTEIPWREAGGTRQQLFAEITRTPGDTLASDTVAWSLDSLSVAAAADSAFPGFLITVEGGPARLNLRALELQTALRPASSPDTAIADTISATARTFVFTPEPPPAAAAWQIGGAGALGGERVLFSFQLPNEVPACAEAAGPTCGTIALDEVTINEATLLLDPLPVPNGFQPLAPFGVQLRLVGEPELGANAPLGCEVAAENIPAANFAAPGDSVIALSLTPFVSGAICRPAPDEEVESTFTLALLGNPRSTSFGIARFAPTPRLRLVYTLPFTPEAS